MDANALNEMLSQNLQSLLDEKGLNPSAWAKAAGMGHTGVRDIIKKKVKNPTYRTLVNLAEAANVDIRRITVGPNYLDVDEHDAEILDLLHQLDPPVRQFLLDAARAQVAERNRSRKEHRSEEK